MPDTGLQIGGGFLRPRPVVRPHPDSDLTSNKIRENNKWFERCVHCNTLP